MAKGKRYDTTPKLNLKKVFALIITILVIVMVFISLKNIVKSGGETATKDVSTLKTYITILEGGKWGVIDNKGEQIIPPAYNEMIVIPDENKDIFVCTELTDPNQEIYSTRVVNAANQEVFKDKDGIAPIENSDGKTIWVDSKVLKFKKDSKLGLIDLNGKVVLEADYEDIVTIPGVKNVLLVKQNGKYGVFNTTALELIIDAKYNEIKTLSNDYKNGFIVKDDTNLYGIIGADKKELLEIKYEDIKPIVCTDSFVVVKDGQLRLVSTVGTTILSDGFDSIESVDGDYVVAIKGGKYGILSKEGKQVVSFKYEGLKHAFDKYYIAQKDGLKGIIDIEDEEKVPFTYEDMYFVDNIFVADKSQTSSDLIDQDFEVKVSDVIVSNIDTENGYIRIRDGQDYKYYNFKLEEKTNKEALTTNTLFLVKENGKYGYVNKNDEKVVECIYDDATEQNKFGFCSVMKDGLWGSIKADGTVVQNTTIDLKDYMVIDFIGNYHKYNDLLLNVYTK